MSKKRRCQNESAEDIRLFLSNLAQKNYAEANKYLSNAVQVKMKARVKDSANKIGF